jgi:hypothetical protein
MTASVLFETPDEALAELRVTEKPASLTARQVRRLVYPGHLRHLD